MTDTPVDTPVDTTEAPVEETSAPTQGVSYSAQVGLNVIGGFVSLAQAQGFKNLLDGRGLTEQQLVAQYANLDPDTMGPDFFNRLSRDVAENNARAQAGKNATDAQVGHLTSCMHNCAAHPDGQALAASIKAVLSDVSADAERISRAISAAHQRMSLFGIPVPQRQEKANTTEGSPAPGALEGSVVSGAVPGEEPF